VAESVAFEATDKAARYAELLPQAAALLDGEPDLIANLANVTALLRACLPVASWVGFYVLRGDTLVLGPFQGNVACVRIAIGRGVCGTAAAERRTIVVDDVEQFPGHIACDAGSRSEIVVPLLAHDRLVGVLDVDSYELAAFDAIDQKYLEMLGVQLGALAW
jgi:L-methionine (R)-S-oxide reductase